jgi:hypothetical protein
MKTPKLQFALSAGAVVALFFLVVGSATAGSVQYLVTVDTSAVNTTSGFLDFQFNPGSSDSQPATAQITKFIAGGGALAGSPSVSGDVTGTLPATVTMVNESLPVAFNDYFQPFTFGGFFSFELSLTGPALDHPNGTSTAGSTFGVGLYDQSQNSILTNDTFNGFAGEVLVNLDGSSTPQSFPTATGGPTMATFQELPEPDTLILLGCGSLALFFRRRSRA